MASLFKKIGRLPVVAHLVDGIIYATTWLVRRVPLRWMDRFAIAAGSFVWWLGIGHSPVLENLAKAFPELPERTRRRIGRRSVCNFLRTVAEILRLSRWSEDDLCRHVTWLHAERVLAAQAKGRGVLVLSAHTGNFELIAISTQACKCGEASLIGRDLHTRAADSILKRSRASHGVRTISPRGAFRRVVRELREQRSIGVVLDQRAKRKAAVWVNFFGHPAATMPTLAVLAERTGAPVVPIFARRTGCGQHVIEAFPEIPYVDTGDRKRNLFVNTQRYTLAIERIVRAYPDQWLWSHERWRSRRWPDDVIPVVPDIEEDLLQPVPADLPEEQPADSTLAP